MKYIENDQFIVTKQFEIHFPHMSVSTVPINTMCEIDEINEDGYYGENNHYKVLFEQVIYDDGSLITDDDFDIYGWISESEIDKYMDRI